MRKRGLTVLLGGVQNFFDEERYQRQAQHPAAQTWGQRLWRARIVHMGCRLGLEQGREGCSSSRQRSEKHTWHWPWKHQQRRRMRASAATDNRLEGGTDHCKLIWIRQQTGSDNWIGEPRSFTIETTHNQCILETHVYRWKNVAILWQRWSHRGAATSTSKASPTKIHNLGQRNVAEERMHLLKIYDHWYQLYSSSL